MKSGSPIDRIPEPVHGQQQQQPPEEDPSSGGAATSSPPPLSAGPVLRRQGGVRGRAVGGGGGRGTDGSTSAAAWADRKGKAPAADPPAPSGIAGGSPYSSSYDSACSMDDSKQVFDRLMRDLSAINQAQRMFVEEAEADEGQVLKSAPWSRFKSYFSRKKIFYEEEWIHSEHVGRQTRPITEFRQYYRIAEHKAIHVNFDAYSRFRRVLGDGECFYRSFIFSYLEQVLDRQDTHEEHRLLDTVKGVSMQHTNLGWASKFSRSYKDMHNCLTVVAWNHSLHTVGINSNSNYKANNPILTTMNLKRNLLAKEQRENITWTNVIAFKKLIKKVMGWKRQGRWNSRPSTESYREEKLLEFFSKYKTTEHILVFLRFVVAIHICSHEDEYEELIPGLNLNYTLKDWCFEHVIPSREFTDHIMMVALGTALAVPLRVEQLQGAAGAQDMYEGPGAVSVTLLYTGNHYDILYPCAPPASSSSQQSTSQREHRAD